VKSRQALAALWVAAVLLSAGCARSPGLGASPAGPGVAGAPQSHRLLETTALPADAEEAEDYDPWQPFNEKMFAFNHGVLDRFLIKPAATGWAKVMPGVARRSFARMLDNLEMPARLVNNLLQARPVGAGRELARFAVNTTVGVAGLMDVASKLDIEPSEADAGQTLALYGVGAGPFLVLPTFPPLTVRDAIGRGIDGALDPVGYFLPFIANQAKSIVSAVNERSLNLKLYADVEDSVLDLYSAARNGYLQRRRLVVERAIASRNQEWEWAFKKQPTLTAQQPAPPAASGPQDPA
jgi:phospholipid-binding lipoprotein MlaA